MFKFFSVSFVILAISFSVFAQSKNDSFICFNADKDIDSKGYFHYVFETDKLESGDKVIISDYANNYKKINATVTLRANTITLKDNSQKFLLTIDLNQKFKPGAGLGDYGYISYITHRNQENYEISCATSGAIQLE